MTLNTDKIKLCAFADEASPILDEQIEAMQANGISLLEIRGVDDKNISDNEEEIAENEENTCD